MDRGRSETDKVSSRVGLLGGTFDPIHLGHLRAAEETAEELGLDKVYLLPTGSLPHKSGGPWASFQHRLQMVRLGVGGNPVLEPLDLEGRRPGLSYSIDTLRELTRSLGNGTELYFIVGLDAFMKLDTWKEYPRLFEYAHFVIIPRPGSQPAGVRQVLSKAGLDIREEPGAEFQVLPTGKGVALRSCTSMDISSTRIRDLVRAGKSIRYLVPEAVRRYIEEKGLYTIDGNH